MRRLLVLWLLVAGARAQTQLEDTFYVPLEHPAIHYDQAPGDPVARLEERLEKGQTHLDYASNGWGYLPSILKELGIHTDSQVLVFSKTSIQLAHIAPRTPRAIYFNDDVAVGYVQNGDVLELTSLDPKLGTILYTMDTAKAAKPEFNRRDDCLKCHQGPVTLGVPGILVSSVHPGSGGAQQGHGGAYMTDDRIPISERWGGWYVTGTTGSQTTYGNDINLSNPLEPGPAGGPATQNLTSLTGLLDTSRYLAPTSDLVALMTLEHQTRMTNLITRVGWDTRIAQHDGKSDEATRKQLDYEIEQLVKYMVFADEAPLKEPVAGVSTFTKTFPQWGPQDHQGRSLRDFDLRTRLFRYPVSYMIYSPAFDALPDSARERIYRRLHEVLSGKDQSQPFEHLSGEQRRTALEIVRQTKKNLPAYWTAAE